MGEQLHKEGKENGDKVVKDMEAVAKFNPLIHHGYRWEGKRLLSTCLVITHWKISG